MATSKEDLIKRAKSLLEDKNALDELNQKEGHSIIPPTPAPKATPKVSKLNPSGAAFTFYCTNKDCQVYPPGMDNQEFKFKDHKLTSVNPVVVRHLKDLVRLMPSKFKLLG